MACPDSFHPGITSLPSDSFHFGKLYCTTGTYPSGTMNISADQMATYPMNVYVVGYGCQYQGGYVFAVDDTTDYSQPGTCTSPPCIGSIGGKVVTPSNTGSAAWGVSDEEVVGAQSPTDGIANTQAIIAQYPDDTNNYAANICSKLADNQSWYLPAICEMGYDSFEIGSGCGTSEAPMLQNIQSNLVDLGVPSFPIDTYWSSTERSGNPITAWYQNFTGKFQGGALNNSMFSGPLCATVF